ncbi:MAG: ABC-2 type transport system ATP-binding protein [Gammaproteobacteria bacterium]|jgi:ABC-2 type transport system ATP-binding protein
MNEAVKVSNLVKYYGKQSVLSDISLNVVPGEFLGLIGVNGAGKTTLIKCLLDFTQINSGSINLFGATHTQPKARERLAFLPEKFIPPYYLSGKEFLDFMHELHGLDYNAVAVEEMLGILDLDPAYINKPVGQLSKGMSQKIGLAACLLSNKDLLVLDEPMSGLDPRARAYLKQYLLGLKEKGKTLFFSTHMLSDAETLCDKVAILHGGRIRFVGSPAECCLTYDTDDFEQAYLRCVDGEKKGPAEVA